MTERWTSMRCRAKTSLRNAVRPRLPPLDVFRTSGGGRASQWLSKELPLFRRWSTDDDPGSADTARLRRDQIAGRAPIRGGHRNDPGVHALPTEGRVVADRNRH